MDKPRCNKRGLRGDQKINISYISFEASTLIVPYFWPAEASRWNENKLLHFAACEEFCMECSDTECLKCKEGRYKTAGSKLCPSECIKILPLYD